MSAYIVEPKTINRVVSFCILDRDLCEWIKIYGKYDLDTKQGQNMAPLEGIELSHQVS